MKKVIKQVLLVTLMLVLICALSACFLLPDGFGNEGDNKSKEHLQYTLNEAKDGYSVEYLIDNPTYTHLIIPSEYEGLPITAINRIFSSKIEKITIPASVKYIADGAISEAHTAIDVDKNNAHYKTVDGSLYTKDGSVLVRYASGKKDTSFTLPNTVTTLGEGAFSKSEHLTSIVLSQNITVIPNYAFSNSKALKSITLPNGIISIGLRAFSYCSSLTSITIPDSVTNIDSGILEGCESLAEIVIGNSLTNLNWIDFSQHPSLKNVVIGNSITAIDEGAFAGLTTLESVTIGNFVATIGKETFKDCTSLKSVSFGENNKLTVIESGTFDGCSALSGVQIPASVTKIGDKAFFYCSNITNISLDTVTEIGKNAFSGCSALAKVVLSDNIKYVGSNAFGDCNALVCNEDDNAYYLGNEQNQYLVLMGVKNKQIVSFDISTQTKIIYSNVFSECELLESVNIPSSVTSIGSFAFSHCKALTSVTIPISVTTLGDYVFTYCSSLGSVELPESISAIPDGMFYNCESLSNVQIPNSVTTIGANAFDGCKTITEVRFSPSLTSIGEQAFAGCYKLQSVYIPDTVTYIGYKAFYKCSNLKIYCQAKSKPNGWDKDWNYSNCDVSWNHHSSYWDKTQWAVANDIFARPTSHFNTQMRKTKTIFSILETFPKKGLKFYNIYCYQYTGETIDYATGLFVEECRNIVDYGFDMYAPQTFANKTTLIGWLNMWDRNVPSAKYGFAGMLTAPRRVFIQNGALCQDPIVNCAPVHKATVANKLADNVLTGVITIKATGVTNFHLKMRCDGVNATTLGLIDGQGGGVSVPSQASKSLAKKGTPTHLMEFAVCPSPTKGT